MNDSNAVTQFVLNADFTSLKILSWIRMECATRSADALAGRCDGLFETLRHLTLAEMMWLLRSLDAGVTTTDWGGLAQDTPVDGMADIAVCPDGIWFIRRSSDGIQTAVGWGGLAQDIPLN
jgi:hypothetical protein